MSSYAKNRPPYFTTDSESPILSPDLQDETSLSADSSGSSDLKDKCTQTTLSSTKHFHASRLLCYDVGCWTTKSEKDDSVDKFTKNTKAVIKRRVYGLNQRPVQFLGSLFPLISNILNYKWTWVLKDFISGAVVSMIHLPQAMAGAMTAVMRPQHGLFITIFPGLMYAFLGSSPQNSVGGMPITAALTGVSMSRIREHYHPENYTITNAGEMLDVHFQIAGAVALVAGLFQLLMGIFKLGFLSNIFSTNVMDPFSVACCMQAIFGQVPNMLGIGLFPYCGLAKHPWLVSNMFINIKNINAYDTMISVLAASCILGFREFLQPILFRKTNIVYPIEFFVLVLGALVSYWFNLNERFGVRILGAIPESLPLPQPPPMDYIPHVLGEGFINALVSFGLTISSAKILARKEGNKISPSQELIAIGSANVFGSFFSCFISAAPVGRSVINQSMGSKSQLSTIFGCLFMMVLFLSVGQSLYYLPVGIVSANIVVTLIMTLKIFGDLPTLWKASKPDTFTWIITFTACIVLDVRVGLIIGITFSLFFVTYRSHRPKVRVLGRIKKSAGYLPLKEYREATEIPGIKILQVQSAFHFGNAEYLVKKIKSMIIDPNPPPVADPGSYIATVVNEREESPIGRRRSVVAAVMIERNRVHDQETSRPLLEQTNHQVIPLGTAKSAPNLADFSEFEEAGFDKPSSKKTKFSFKKLTLSVNDPNKAKSLMRPSSSATASTDTLDELETDLTRAIIDLNMTSFIDSVGLRALEQIASDLEKLGVEILLSQNKGSITDQIKRLKVLKTIPERNIFLCVEDAVAEAKRRIRKRAEPDHIPLEETPDNRFWPTPAFRVEGLPGTN
ncbi:prestin-like [Paramacrobiotus metropolitanus]|uniref:prestin-like n=1 Tax=Paramacrobiotus metropolitanus TaxID=2943436 RepID=UPI00244657E0|nr:prestin-like [Paramacrobiotus metropolitanus]